MMNQEQAAKYLVVAWVKGWSLRLYWKTVASNSANWDQAHTSFAWMPKDITAFILNQSIQRYVADNFNVLNNKLWDCSTNEQRIALTPIVMQCRGDDAKVKLDKEKIKVKSANKISRQTYLKVGMSTEEMRRGRGHHWNVCK